MPEHKTVYSYLGTTPELAKIDEIFSISLQLKEHQIILGKTLRHHLEEFDRGRDNRMNFESYFKHSLGIPSYHMPLVYECIRLYWNSELKREDDSR